MAENYFIKAGARKLACNSIPVIFRPFTGLPIIKNLRVFFNNSVYEKNTVSHCFNCFKHLNDVRSGCIRNAEDFL